eukprot:scaffold8497_cov69-Phaeocystis_antarctica.AAC.1
MTTGRGSKSAQYSWAGRRLQATSEEGGRKHWTTREFIGHTWELSTPWSGHTISRSMRMLAPCTYVHMIHHFPLPSPSDAHVDAAPLARAALLAELDRGGGVVGAALRAEGCCIAPKGPRGETCTLYSSYACALMRRSTQASHSSQMGRKITVQGKARTCE